MKSADDIKKGLKCCNRTFDACHECPYDTVEEGWGCTVAKNADALALIQQLEAENTRRHEKIIQLYNDLESLRNIVTTIVTDSKETYKQLEAERDAAVADLKSYRCCHGCKHLGVGFNEPCLHCDFENNCFEWRGVQKEDSDAVSS